MIREGWLEKYIERPGGNGGKGMGDVL